ncbi:hypothetical protein NST23_18630 [Brevibacillus sp. FSL K6-0770]|uniref:hypothetical protein n=1 Tax=Brevibacillus sp. FSL K6-0770 TaxID=2954673 RepID=UPI0030F5D8CB
MIHFTYRMIDANKAEIETVYNIDPPKEALDRCVKYDGSELPMPENIPAGKGFRRYYYPVTNTFDFEFFDRPLTPDEQLELLQKETKVDVALAQREQDIRERIATGEIKASTFSSLTAEEQDLVTLVLFKDYSPAKEEIPKALSAVEFGLVVLFKLLGKAIDRTKLSAEEQQYLDAMLTTINLNDMPINDTNDWRYQYFHQQFEKTQQNRQDYYNAKMTVTGTW